MRKKSATQTPPPLSDGRTGDIRVPWVQDMGGTCPKCTFTILFIDYSDLHLFVLVFYSIFLGSKNMRTSRT
jgi:hypothetical protein